jgi:hypothetical protein
MIFLKFWAGFCDALSLPLRPNGRTGTPDLTATVDTVQRVLQVGSGLAPALLSG